MVCAPPPQWVTDRLCPWSLGVDAHARLAPTESEFQPLGQNITDLNENIHLHTVEIRCDCAKFSYKLHIVVKYRVCGTGTHKM